MLPDYIGGGMRKHIIIKKYVTWLHWSIKIKQLALDYERGVYNIAWEKIDIFINTFSYIPIKKEIKW